MPICPPLLPPASDAALLVQQPAPVVVILARPISPINGQRVLASFALTAVSANWIEVTCADKAVFNVDA